MPTSLMQTVNVAVMRRFASHLKKIPNNYCQKNNGNQTEHSCNNLFIQAYQLRRRWNFL